MKHIFIYWFIVPFVLMSFGAMYGSYCGIQYICQQAAAKQVKLDSCGKEE